MDRKGFQLLVSCKKSIIYDSVYSCSEVFHELTTAGGLTANIEVFGFETTQSEQQDTPWVFQGCGFSSIVLKYAHK